MEKIIDSYYYEVHVSYEIPYNILESTDPNVIEARDILYSRLKSIIPEDRYEKFSVKLVMYQLRDTLNYLMTYSSFFRSQGPLVTADWCEAKEVRDSIENELEEFFKNVDCEYKKINIKYFY